MPHPADAAKKSAPPLKWVLLLLVLVLGGGFVAYDQTEVVKATLGDIGNMFEEKGPPEVAVDENPLLQQHGSRILVATSPPGAKVYLDGKEQGIAPVALTGLMEGEYQVRIEAPGFASWSTTVQLGHGETSGVNAGLIGKQGGAKPGAYGRVSVETTPPTNVYIAGDLLGRTPMETVYAPIGRIELEFELPDGRKIIRKVRVKSGEVARANFDLTTVRR